MGTHVKRSQAKLMQLKHTKKDLSKRQSLIRKEMNRVGSMHDNEFDEKEDRIDPIPHQRRRQSRTQDYKDPTRHRASGK